MTTTLPDKARFSPTEAAKFLDISVKTIYSWVHNKTLPADKVGEKLIKIPRAALLEAKKRIEY